MYAGGVSLGATRLIYNTDQNQQTLKIYNSDKNGNYLIQSWISDENGNKVSDFIITPPLFIIKSNSDSLLNIVFTEEKDKLPKDKEKLYFLNTKVIPSLTDDEQKKDNVLLISTTTKIKMFVRPSSINGSSFDSYKYLKCSYDKDRIKIENPTPFYINMVSLVNGSYQISNAETISPKSYVYVDNKNGKKELKFNIINDYGVQIKDQNCNFN